MNFIKIVFIIMFASHFSCSSILKENALSTEIAGINKERFSDSLAFELCEIFGLDQGIRNSGGYENKMRAIQNTDTLNFNRLIDFIKKHGIPNEKLLGKENYSHECVKAAFGAVMLHNPHRIVNEKENFDFFISLIEKDQLKPETLALILDKYYWSKSRGKSVLYGSQFGKPCVETKAKTNKARKVIGLEALPDSLFVKCNN